MLEAFGLRAQVSPSVEGGLYSIFPLGAGKRLGGCEVPPSLGSP